MKKSILEVVHEFAKGLFYIGLMDAKIMHTFDAICFPTVRKLSPKKSRIFGYVKK
jgi:DNA-binding transcriptional regulator YiaG